MSVITPVVRTYGAGLPGVYVEDITTQAIPLNDGMSDFVCGLVGLSPRGPVGKSVYIRSWADYIRQYSFGLISPFNANMDLAYAVYGFFSNGGRLLHIARVSPTTATTAKTVGDFAQVTGGGLVAYDPGAWGNDISVVITKNETVPTNVSYDASIRVGGNERELFKGLKLTHGNNFFLDVLSGSYIIQIDPLVDETATFVEENILGTFTFAGGDDKLEDVADIDYVNALRQFDQVVDLNIVAIPGQSTTQIRAGLIEYAAVTRGDVFAIIDPPQNATISSLYAIRNELNSMHAAMYYPYGLMADPLSATGNFREIPPSGHVAGMYCRTVQRDGIKAPAGEEAQIKTFADLSVIVNDTDAGNLHDIGINCIMERPAGVGIVVWGDRSLADPNDFLRRYVTDGLVYCIVRKNCVIQTTKYIFMRNNQTTRNMILSEIKAFMSRLFEEGTLAGVLPEQAYYVALADDMNTTDSINRGILWVDVAYAATKPLEFLNIRIQIRMEPMQTEV